jgi:hypothetical protein
VKVTLTRCSASQCVNWREQVTSSGGAFFSSLLAVALLCGDLGSGARTRIPGASFIWGMFGPPAGLPGFTPSPVSSSPVALPNDRASRPQSKRHYTIPKSRLP